MLDRCAKFILYPAQRCCYFKLRSHSTRLIFGRAINCFKQAAHSPPAAGEHCMRLLLIMWSHTQPSHGIGDSRGTISTSAQQQLLPSLQHLSAGLLSLATLPCKVPARTRASQPKHPFWHRHPPGRPGSIAPEGVNCLYWLQRTFLPMTAWGVFWGRMNALDPWIMSHCSCLPGCILHSVYI